MFVLRMCKLRPPALRCIELGLKKHVSFAIHGRILALMARLRSDMRQTLRRPGPSPWDLPSRLRVNELCDHASIRILVVTSPELCHTCLAAAAEYHRLCALPSSLAAACGIYSHAVLPAAFGATVKKRVSSTREHTSCQLLPTVERGCRNSLPEIRLVYTCEELLD